MRNTRSLSSAATLVPPRTRGAAGIPRSMVLALIVLWAASADGASMVSSTPVPSLTCPLVLSGEETLLLWRASTYDQDGDGYAVWNAHRDDRCSVASPGGVAPDGWVEKRGDLDDGDPEVHPRRPEEFGNGIDDDCDDRIDEPEFEYAPSGNGNTTDAFSMEVHINDSDTVDVWNARSRTSGLYYRIEYQNLRNTSDLRSTSLARLSSLEVYPSLARTTLHLAGLPSGQVFRARVQFYSSSRGAYAAVGPVSDWYYSITDWDGEVAHARTAAVLRGFYEYYLSEHLGYVGYLGATYEDGTRYGAEPGEAWCSEFYAFTMEGEVVMPATISYWQDLIDYFSEEGSYTEVGEAGDFIDAADPGDYLAQDGGTGVMQHSAMFLAYDSGTGETWTLNGNGTGTADWTYGGYEYRLGGDEVTIESLSPDVVAGWGHILPAMLD